MSEKTSNFIKTVGLLARNEFLSREKWILPSVAIAQAALESGWNLAARSVFGIKGNGFTSTTSEFYNGNYVQIQDTFRDYPDLASSVVGYYDFLRDTITEDGLNVRYDRALNKSDYHEAIDGLINTYDYPYATDPEYIENIVSIIEYFDLTQYDAIESAIPEVEEVIAPIEEIAPQGMYVVQSGDCLSVIAQKLGVDMQELADFNGIGDVSLIYPGQVLTIPGVGQVAEPQPEVVEEPQPESFREYTVQPGDCLSIIAQNYGVDTQALADFNGIGDANSIWAGITLRIPN